MINTCNALGSCGLSPDVTVIFDLAPEVALSRATKGGADRLEGEGLAFQRRIREAYQRLAVRETARVRVVDADGSMDEVYARLDACLSDVLPSLRDGEDS